jgi:hypothetical protein
MDSSVELRGCAMEVWTPTQKQIFVLGMLFRKAFDAPITRE